MKKYGPKHRTVWNQKADIDKENILGGSSRMTIMRKLIT